MHGYIAPWPSMVLGESLLPSLSIYIRQANYEKLRKAAEKNAETIGQTQQTNRRETLAHTLFLKACQCVPGLEAQAYLHM